MRVLLTGADILESGTNSGLQIQTVLFPSFSTLNVQGRQASYSPTMNVVNLAADDQPHIQLDFTPWSMGIMSHGKYWKGPDVQAADPVAYEMTSRGTVTEEGGPHVDVRITDRVHRTAFRYLLDPSRGHLPAVVSVHTPGKPLIDGREGGTSRLSTPRRNRAADGSLGPGGALSPRTKRGANGSCGTS